MEVHRLDNQEIGFSANTTWHSLTTARVTVTQPARLHQISRTRRLVFAREQQMVIWFPDAFSESSK